VAALAAAALAIPGCGGDSDSSSTTRPASGPSPRTPRTAPAAAWRAPPAWAARVRRAAARSGLPAGAAIASSRGGPVTVAGSLRSDAAWSTIKVPLLVAYLKQRPRASSADREIERRLIVASDNDAANTLFFRLGGQRGAAGPLRATLASAGDRDTALDIRRPDGVRTFTWIGQTRWSLAASVVYLRALARGRLARPRATAVVEDLLLEAGRSAAPWGLKAAVAGDTPLAMKVGVGTTPDGDWTVRQLALVGPRRRACVVAVLARGPSEGQAKEAATAVARAAAPPALQERGCAAGAS
jgi:beta-lactamase class A